MNQFQTLSSVNTPFSHVLCAMCAALFISLPACAEQLWLTQGVSAHATESLRLSFFNTVYLEHGKQFSNEESLSFRLALTTNWSAGAGMSLSQNRRTREDGRHHWDCSNRPSENIVVDWAGRRGDWNFFDSHGVTLYFRKGERDWGIYRNIFTVTAPAIPRAPCNPRPYLTQHIYFTGRDGYDGLDRFYQFRTTAGLRLRPLDHLSLAAYWQYRDIQSRTGDRNQDYIAGLSATVLF